MPSRTRRRWRVVEALSEIRRVSARRRVSWRERAGDRASVAALLLALPAALLLVPMVRSLEGRVVLAGWVGLPPPPTGPIAAAAPPPQVPEVRFARREGEEHAPWGGAAAVPGTRPLGEFRLVRERERCGWPFACRFLQRPDRLEIVAHADAGEWSGRLGAIVVREAAGRVDEVEEGVRWSLLPLAANALVAATLLMAAGQVVVLGAAVGRWALAAAAAQRRERRRRRGGCPRCGHDTRANLWSAQCPECGELLR